MWRSLFLSAGLVAGVVMFAADPKPQPIPFSHKTHIEEAGQQCRDCHKMPGTGEAAGFPPESLCMDCHSSIKTDSPSVAKLAEYYRDHKSIPWVRVYRIPPNVWFSHKSHVEKAKVDCAVCHGAVATHDAMVKEKPTTMKFCMDCHEANKASVACDFCHNPG